MGNTLSADAFHELGEAISRGKEELHGDLLMKLEDYVKTDRDALLQMTLDNEAVAVKALVDSARCRIPAFQLDTARILTTLMRPTGPEDKNAVQLQAAVARYRGISPFVLMGISTSVDHQIAGADALGVLAQQPMARLDIDEAGGMKPLIILMLSMDENLQLAASSALANMCADHMGQDEAEHVPPIIRKRCTLYGGIETMIRLMVLERTPRRVMAEIARLCGNIAESENTRHRIATQATLGHFGLEMILRHVRACRDDPSPESKQILSHLTRALSHLAKDEANARLFCMPLLDDLGLQRQENEYRTRMQQRRRVGTADDDEADGNAAVEDKPHFVGVNLLIDLASAGADPAEEANDADEAGGKSSGLLSGSATIPGSGDASGKSLAEEHSVNASVALLHLSLDESTQRIILDADGLRPLMHLAETTVGTGGEQEQVALQRRAIWSLLTIASGSSMSRTGAEMRQTAKTAQYLVLPLLRVLQVATDSVVRRLCARALSFLAMRADCQRSIIVGDKPAPAPGSGEVPAGVKLLMEVSKRGQGEDMAQKEATRTLANLCMVREAEALEMLRASGVSDLFQRLLDNTQSGSLTMQAHLAMANLDPPPLSMEHEHFRATPMYDMIHDFVAVTEQTNPQLQCKAAGALAVLAQASCTHFKMIQEDGIQRLVRLLRSSLVSIAAQREAASALAQLSMHPDGMTLWLKFESPNRIATDTAGECVPVPRGVIPHVRDAGYRACELPIGYAAAPSVSPESESDSEDEDVSQGQHTARTGLHSARTGSQRSAASATTKANFAFKGKTSPVEGRKKRSARTLEQIRAAGEWGASFGQQNTVILGRDGVPLPEEYSISVWFYGSGSGPGIDGDRFQTLVECVNGDRIACVHPGADGRNRLLGCFQRERRQFMACGLSMDDLAPAAWHHMVILVARGQTTFYIDGEDAGELPTFATTSPILSVGNAVATGEAFGTIADFRVFPRPLNVRERVLNPHAPFNALPWTPSALRGGEDNLSYDSTQVVRGGAVPALISLLPNREPEVMLPAVKAIANLALHAENRVKLLEESALQPLVTLSNSEIEELRREACRALVNLF